MRLSDLIVLVFTRTSLLTLGFETTEDGGRGRDWWLGKICAVWSDLNGLCPSRGKINWASPGSTPKASVCPSKP